MVSSLFLFRIGSPDFDSVVDRTPTPRAPLVRSTRRLHLFLKGKGLGVPARFFVKDDSPTSFAASGIGGSFGCKSHETSGGTFRHTGEERQEVCTGEVTRLLPLCSPPSSDPLSPSGATVFYFRLSGRGPAHITECGH